ncbi:MAG: molybdopterin-dependent oxidoreductase [Ilumatobacteraceae bacterium]
MQATATTATRTASVATGLVAGVAALGIGELVGSFQSTWRSPVVAVADAVIERVPNSVKDFGVEKFGTNDKIALIVGILIFSVIFACVLGLVSRRRPLVSMGGFVAFALVGVWGSQQSFTSTFAGVLPSIAAGAAGVAAIAVLRGWQPAPAEQLAAADVDTASGPDAPAQPMIEAGVTPVESPGNPSPTRRMFLASAAAIAVVAAAAAAGGRALRSRFSAAGSRADVTLPAPVQALAEAPGGVSVDVAGVSSFYTPNADFYRIDTAVEVPQVLAEDWSLRIHGMVDKEVTFTFDDLLKRNLVEYDITLTCVSNTVGGSLLGNARWLGVPLRELLDEAGVQPGADQLVGRSVDGWTSGFPVETLNDDRPALLAIGMNGEPLPLEHGFPARVIVSGIYGYVSATKWITEFELTTFDKFDAYWVERKWDDRAPIKTMSRIDTPRSLQKVPAGTVNVGGVAWAQTVGISKVELKIDDGEFFEATLADELNVNTWRLWSAQFENATPGQHRLTVKATDNDGNVQTDERADPFPNGASGWMSVLFQVTEAGA